VLPAVVERQPAQHPSTATSATASSGSGWNSSSLRISILPEAPVY